MNRTSLIQTLTISNNLQDPEIDASLRKVSKENSLPSIEVVHYANMWFNLCNSPNFIFQPSLAVKEQLYYAAHSKLDQCGIHLGKDFNYTNLSASDTAALFYILNSFQAYEKEKKGELAIFPKVVFYFEQYIVRLCHRDESKARRVLDALISYNNPSNDALIEKMRSNITTIAKTNRAHNPTGQNQFSLPEDIWLEIFKNYLSPKDLGQVIQVCKQFQILASSDYVWNAIEKRLPNLYPSLRFIGPEAWGEYVDLERFGLTLEQPAVEGAAPGSKHARLRSTLKATLKALKQLGSRVENNEGMTILTIPKGLSLNKLVELAKSPKHGNAANFRLVSPMSSPTMLEDFGHVSVNKTYRIVITNSILKGSKSGDADLQKKLANSLNSEMVTILEVSTLAIMTYMITSNRLYRNYTNTRCSDELGVPEVRVGDFSQQDGLLIFCWDHITVGTTGIGVKRELPE